MKIDKDKLIKELCRRSWTMADLGRKMGKSRQSIHDIVHADRHRNFSTLGQLAKVLEMDIDDIVR